MTSRSGSAAVCALELRNAFVALLFVVLASTAVWAQTVDPAKLMAESPLPDHTLGDAAAPVTIIEYASLTCHHCSNFHKQTWPAFKAKYVETGKVRFIFREFPLDPLAMGAVMLTRCIGDDKLVSDARPAVRNAGDVVAFRKAG